MGQKKTTARKKTTAKKSSASKSQGFTAEERAAMKERARELKAEARRGAKREEGERDLLEKIKEMPKADRVLAERVHAIVSEVAPDLMPKTWYGMPAYAKDDKILFFFQAAAKFGSRYATFGFNDVATLDSGVMWPTAFALTEINDAEEKKLRSLVKKAAS